MAMTAAVKDELSRLDVTKPCCRKAEVSAMLRFAGGLHIVGGRIVVEAELDTGAAARRLRRDIAEVYGHTSEIVVVLASGGLRKGSRYVVRVVKDGEALARQTGLLDGRGRPVRGLPPQVVSGARVRRRGRLARRVPRPRLADRAGPLVRARDHLPGPRGRARAGRRGPPARHPGQGPRGARRRPGGDPRRRRDRALLTRLGAHDSVLAWEERRMRREVRATANRLANFDDANLRRSARAAVAAGARVERALEILGDDVPDHLATPASCGSSTSRPAWRSSARSPTRR